MNRRYRTMFCFRSLILASASVVVMFVSGCATQLLTLSNKRRDQPVHEFELGLLPWQGRYLGTVEEADISYHHFVVQGALTDSHDGRELELLLPTTDADERRAILREVRATSVASANGASRPVVVQAVVGIDGTRYPRVDWEGYPSTLVVVFADRAPRLGEVLVRYPTGVGSKSGSIRWAIAWARVTIDRCERSTAGLYGWRSLYVFTVPFDIAMFPLQIAMYVVHYVTS